MRQKKKGLILLLGCIAMELFLIALAVWFFDPFYQYHAPFLGRQAVFNDRDNQMPGSVRVLDYDSVLVGSSVVENCDSEFLDRQFGCRSLKIIRASGSAADLLYYLDMAWEEHELTSVFWCLDLPALNSDTQNTFQQGNEIDYLHTGSILDDGTYLWNKDILFVTIPNMLAYEKMGRNVGGRAYDWSEGKEFSAQKAMEAYAKPEGVCEAADFSHRKEDIRRNVEALAQQIESHPETSFRFFFPPYSMNWWDCAYVNGELEEKFYILEQTLPVLLAYENVEVYYFQDEVQIISNLDNYMDLVHYSPEVNQYMLDCIAAGEKRVTPENWQEVIRKMRDVVQLITGDLIYRYYPRQ